MCKNRSVILVALEAILIIVAGYSLWYRIFLPTTYFFVAFAIAALIVLQMLRKGNHYKFIAFQIAFLLLFMNNVYYLATNYHIIPFDDGNWDYGVTKTFIQESNIFTISEQNVATRNLAWYSGWPLLHSLVISISQISGINTFHLFLVLPSLISMTSLLFVYLVVEKVRASMKLDTMVTPFTLLIYVCSAEAKFWPIQLVRQNLGLMIFVMLIYTLYLSRINATYARRYKALTLFLAVSLVVTHHFTSFMTVSYLLLFFGILTVGKHIGRTKTWARLFWKHPSPTMATLAIAFLMSSFLILWWDHFGMIIWPRISSSLTRLRGVLLGTIVFEYTRPPAYYPEPLTPMWATSLLVLRDILIYVSAFLGLFLIWSRKRKNHHEFFVIYSVLAFGLLLIIDNFALRVESFRIFGLTLPFVSLLGATFYMHHSNNKKIVWRTLFTTSFVTVLVFSSFIGLWGHSFAPIHLYDSSVNAVEVGERNTDFMRVNNFFSQRIPINSLQAIWTDDYGPLVLLLQPINYPKIIKLSPEYTQRSLLANELICAFKDLYLYSYYAREYSLIGSRQEANRARCELYEYLDNGYNRIYDDGKYKFWLS